MDVFTHVVGYAPAMFSSYVIFASRFFGVVPMLSADVFSWLLISVKFGNGSVLNFDLFTLAWLFWFPCLKFSSMFRFLVC